MFSAEQLMTWTQSFYWPFLRISALFLSAPVFSASSLPVRARVLLAVFVSALVAPSLPVVAEVDMLGPEGLLLAGQQILIGIAMGFVMQMVFGSIVVAGQSMAMTMGLGFAMAVDPQNGVQVPVLSQLYVILATLIFLVTNTHLLMIEILIESFQLLPVGLFSWHSELLMNTVLFASQMFLGALLLSLPVLTAILLVNLAFGVITRAAPQLNIFAVGFPVTIMVGFVFILLTMPSVLSLLSKMFEGGLTAMLNLLH